MLQFLIIMVDLFHLRVVVMVDHIDQEHKMEDQEVEEHQETVQQVLVIHPLQTHLKVKMAVVELVKLDKILNHVEPGEEGVQENQIQLLDPP